MNEETRRSQKKKKIKIFFKLPTATPLPTEAPAHKSDKNPKTSEYWVADKDGESLRSSVQQIQGSF